MKGKFNYFLGLVTAYPKVTIFVFGPLILIALLGTKSEGELGLIDTLRMLVGQLVVFINFKVWAVAFFRDKLGFENTGKPFFFVFLMTVLLMILGMLVATPVLEGFVPENLASEAPPNPEVEVDPNITLNFGNEIWLIPLLMALPVTILSLFVLISKKSSLTLNKVFYQSILIALTAGLINLYLWEQLPENSLIPTHYSSKEGFSDFVPKTDALLMWPIMVWMLPLMVKIVEKAIPYSSWLQKRAKGQEATLAGTWLFMLLFVSGGQIFMVFNSQIQMILILFL